MKRLIPIIFLSILTACSGNKKAADAYGNFEADETLISAETAGKIIDILVNEGDIVKAGQTLTVVDTVNLSLQRAQLEAQKVSVEAQRNVIEAQMAVSDQQIANIIIDKKRIENMLKDGAATQKQLDDINGQIDLVRKQKQTNESQLESVQKQVEAAQAQIAVLNDRIQNSIITAPINGTILEKYIEKGELSVAGKNLFKMADISTLTLRVYISETQLSQVKLGQQVTVRIDYGKDSKEFPGKVDWISSQAEFTPKTIQTKEERVKLVYAVKIRVQNDGTLKIGMPGEVIF
jgi:HlyD family secretion protein